MTPLRTSVISTALALICSAHGTALADLMASKGRCPSSSYELYTAPNGVQKCRHIENAKAEERKKAKQADKASAKSSKSSGSSSSGGSYQDPVAASVPKASKLGFCPSGYYTNDDVCTTSWADAPKSTVKSGSCPSGTVEEHGTYCTAVIADTSNDTMDRIDGFATRDFNVVYTASLVAGVKAADHKRGEAFAQAIAKRQAAGDPWQDLRSRNAAKAAVKTPEQLAYEKQQSDLDAQRKNEFAKMCAQVRQAYGGALPGDHDCTKAPEPTAAAPGVPAALGQATAAAQNPQEAVKEAAKQEVSKALRGLFGK